MTYFSKFIHRKQCLFVVILQNRVISYWLRGEVAYFGDVNTNKWYFWISTLKLARALLFYSLVFTISCVLWVCYFKVFISNIWSLTMELFVWYCFIFLYVCIFTKMKKTNFKFYNLFVIAVRYLYFFDCQDDT